MAADHELSLWNGLPHWERQHNSTLYFAISMSAGRHRYDHCRAYPCDNTSLLLSMYARQDQPAFMTATPHVVLYGHDETLHLTRRWLVERMGFDVSTASTVPQMERFCQRHNTRLLVICYTVEAAECDKVIAVAQSTRANLKVALLASLIHSKAAFGLRAAHIFVEDPQV